MGCPGERWWEDSGDLGSWGGLSEASTLWPYGPDQRPVPGSDTQGLLGFGQHEPCLVLSAFPVGLEVVASSGQHLASPGQLCNLDFI